MKILVTGASGFVARELIGWLEKNTNHILYKTNRHTLNVLDEKAVDAYFRKNKIDIVIHCAISGGRRNQLDKPVIVYNNCLMFENLVKQRAKYKLMLVFGSGAEQDRTQDIMNQEESNFGARANGIPRDYYGFSKYIIAHRIKSLNDNIINLRIFNVFGKHEAADRMIKANIIKYINRKPITIYKNRYMDFVGSDDLGKLVNYYIDNGASGLIGRSINVSYKTKITLVSVANIINNLSAYKSDIIIKKRDMDPAYCGSGSKLEMLELKLDGLKKSIRQVYKECQNI